jgi:Mrp family chromosome partitioning ATPase
MLTNWFIENEQTPALETSISFVADATRLLISALARQNKVLILECLMHGHVIAKMYRASALETPSDSLMELHNLETGEVEMRHLGEAAGKCSEFLRGSLHQCL